MTTRININRININPNDYYNPVIDYYNPVIDYYNLLLRFEPCLNPLGLILIGLILILIINLNNSILVQSFRTEAYTGIYKTQNSQQTPTQHNEQGR